jgi:hypothetical protein
MALQRMDLKQLMFIKQKINFNLCLISYTKFNSKSIADLNIKHKKLKYLENHKRKSS